ncbi:cryptochrome/photolyase family protein [Marinitenerispora sediminis]|uniref:Deoxyribodipyrimidine photolyase n=1 Tax=Marinitenerispora sediminis TaxID=1931232 RepID=A0A368T672_9ACTN|nr:deoxyribodipyrimidine photo-lyase [Marinitenerispora sediminis]RCV50493.1 deoxyribodipyrimidine photolyase [Marinitenerispora sediminis]RCV55474.1 deoxyribodipyrimidine photolyase [Marinitenerispora sediminis]RCV59106.1 deoxyribodipyrimidine photolyase [Marinitenerispora sediminis]
MVHAAVVLFTRDLRVHDHPALRAAAAGGGPVLPLFVLDPAILRRAARNRVGYLVEALADLRRALRDRGCDLVLREGDTVAETLRAAEEVRAASVHLSADVSAFAAARSARLRAAARRTGVEVREHPGATVVPPGALTPASGDHYRVFTPYWRAWEAADWRALLPAPGRLPAPPRMPVGRLPGRRIADLGRGAAASERVRGGESAARERLRRWLESGLAAYPERCDDLAAAGTSGLSADLRFGCLSPLEVARRARGAAGSGPFVRQIAWRDFHHQVTAAFPEMPRRDYRPRDPAWWRDDDDAFEAWCAGRTGVPIVDAGMRQLLREGFMHNRARLITAAFLTRTLRVRWQRGADHFHTLLTDGDVADNYGNWQWVAGTGNDTRPNRTMNPLRQARRFDPRGEYVRRYVPELAGLRPPLVHTPWRAPDRPADYPPPLVVLD